MGTGGSRQKDVKLIFASLNRKAHELGKQIWSKTEIEDIAKQLNIQYSVTELVERMNHQGYLLNKGGGTYKIAF
jgi:Mn-dependent DtxR family transcriptional regulator